ncbi:MAG: riboflavin synthase [Acidobacteriaceae bacterium]|nr:riboflavin synthase [Acidobacteriaceae bacterium]
MFTGLIETTGTILNITPGDGATRITFTAPADLVRRLATGNSLAVNGVCLTMLDIEPSAVPPRFSADLAAETVARTTLAGLGPDATVNLEFPTPSGAPLGGHVVQGHVDGTGYLVSLNPITTGSETTDFRLRCAIPAALMRYVVEKGSISVDGISLTVASIDDNEIEIAIIPHTFVATNLHTLTPGSPMNIEVDILGKYAERQQLMRQSFDLTESYLLANGY